MVTAATKLKDTCSLEGKLWQNYSICQCRRYRWHGSNPGEGNGNSLQYSCLGTSMVGWWATVYGVSKSGMGARACFSLNQLEVTHPFILLVTLLLFPLLGGAFCSSMHCFPDSWVGKDSACNAGDPSLIPGWGRFTGEGIGYPPQDSWSSLVAQLVKNPPAMQETWV